MTPAHRVPGGRIADIEVLRGVAILMVLFEHVRLLLFAWHSWLQDFDEGYWRGAAGVDLFFVISGFVISRSLLPRLAQSGDAHGFAAETLGFLVRRFWRLQPAAWVWIAVPLALSLAFNRSGAFEGFSTNFGSATTALLGINNLRDGYLTDGAAVGITFQYWSLSLEEQFYVLLPLLAVLLRRRLALVMLAALAYQFAMPAAQICAATRPGALALGVLLGLWSATPGYALAEPRFLAAAPARAAFVLGLIALLGMGASSLPQPLGPMMYGVVAVLSGALVYAASFGRGYILAEGPLRRTLTYLGGRSYAFYLAHVTGYALAREVLFRADGPVRVPTTADAARHLCLGLLFTCVLAEASYRLIETPCRNYGKSLKLRPHWPDAAPGFGMEA